MLACSTRVIVAIKLQHAVRLREIFLVRKIVSILWEKSLWFQVEVALWCRYIKKGELRKESRVKTTAPPVDRTSSSVTSEATNSSMRRLYSNDSESEARTNKIVNHRKATTVWANKKRVKENSNKKWFKRIPASLKRWFGRRVWLIDASPSSSVFGFVSQRSHNSLSYLQPIIIQMSPLFRWKCWICVVTAQFSLFACSPSTRSCVNPRSTFCKPPIGWQVFFVAATVDTYSETKSPHLQSLSSTHHGRSRFWMSARVPSSPKSCWIKSDWRLLSLENFYGLCHEIGRKKASQCPTVSESLQPTSLSIASCRRVTARLAINKSHRPSATPWTRFWTTRGYRNVRWL